MPSLRVSRLRVLGPETWPQIRAIGIAQETLRLGHAAALEHLNMESETFTRSAGEPF